MYVEIIQSNQKESQIKERKKEMVIITHIRLGPGNSGGFQVLLDNGCDVEVSQMDMAWRTQIKDA